MHERLTREQICELTARKLRAAGSTLAQIRALIGLDGFVDEIIAVVDKRHSNGRVDTIKTIDRLGKKITDATGQSSNYELVVRQMKLGGNGPIMANALANLGLRVTYVGNLGYPNLHPVFEDFARKAEVLSIGEPAHTAFADNDVTSCSAGDESGQGHKGRYSHAVRRI